MSSKKPFLTLEQAKEIVAQYPTPFHIYDEAGIRRTARALKDAFSWNQNFSGSTLRLKRHRIRLSSKY